MLYSLGTREVLAPQIHNKKEEAQQRDKLNFNQCLRILSGHTNAVFLISINHIEVLKAKQK